MRAAAATAVGCPAGPAASAARTDGMPARRRRGIREAAGCGSFPAGREIGARPPYPCTGGRRHAWRPAERPRLRAVAAAMAVVLVRDWKECGRCGLVRVESRFCSKFDNIRIA